MNLTIQHNIPNSLQRYLSVSFAQYFVDADFTNLRTILSDNVYIVIYNRERKEGIETVLEYFKDWHTKVGDNFECEVRWSAQFSQPEIYFTSDKIKQAYILGIENSKIVRILLTPRSFSAVGFSIDEVPYNVGFIEANATKEIEPLTNHYFCPICGKDSKLLNWRKGVIFKKGTFQYWGNKIGLMVNASICPDCHVVCEVSPDSTEKDCLTRSQEQQGKADVAAMSDVGKSKYINNTKRNKKPLVRIHLKPRTNELSRFGLKFHELLKLIVDTNNPDLLFLMLDELTINDVPLKLHVASGQTNGLGDTTYFYIGDGEVREKKIYEYLYAHPSIEAAWQIYLLNTAPTVMPTFWHGGYIVRNYIFDESALNNIKPLECYDISGLSRGNLLLPTVTLSPDGRIADVYCSYWKEWGGLVRDHIRITFLPNGKVKLNEIEPLRLFEYSCGIQL